jgi:hypothetical protein
MKLPAVLPDSFLKALPNTERKKLGKAGMTGVEAQARYVAGQEKKLQQEIYQWLLYHKIYFEWDRMDKRTSGKKGRADFRICIPPGGLWLSAECKAEKKKLSSEQLREAERLIKSGGRYIVVYSLADLAAHVRRLEKVAQGLAKDSFDYRRGLDV